MVRKVITAVAVLALVTLVLGLSLVTAVPVMAAPLAGANADLDWAFNYIPIFGGWWIDETTDANDAGADDFWLGFYDVNGSLYIGMNYQFRQVRVNVSTAGTVGAVTWEYWNGSAWSNLEVLTGFSDGTNDFKNSGTNTVTFATTLPSDWVTTAVNGETFYWVRARTTAEYSTAPRGGQISAVEFNFEVNVYKMDGSTEIGGLGSGAFTITGGADNTKYDFRELSSGVYQLALTPETHNYSVAANGYVNSPATSTGALTTALTTTSVTMLGDLKFTVLDTDGVTPITGLLEGNFNVSGTTEFSEMGLGVYRFAAPTGSYAFNIQVTGYADYSTGSPASVTSGTETAITAILAPAGDTTAPTVEDIYVSGTLINESDVGDTFDVVATFSEAMDTGVTPTISFSPNVVASGTLLFASGAWSGGDTVYTATYDVDDVNEEVADVDVSVGGAEDLAGNPQDPDPTTETDLFDVDTVAPTVGISSTATDPTNVSPIPMTATFSEDVTGFVEGEITVGNGTTSNLVAVSGSVYTFDITPDAGGVVTVDIAGGIAQDDAGNDNTVAVQFTITYDTVAPTVVITSTATDPTNTSPIPITATFSEDVTGFELGEITVGNGTASNFVGSGSVYTFDVTPVADGLVTVDIAGGVAQDDAGNDNTAATQFTIAYDATGQTGGSSDSGGNTKDRYRTNEDVWVSASGFLPDSYVDVYVVRDRAWRDGDAIPSYVVKKTIQTDGSGNLGPARIWSAPLDVGEYDVVFDAYQDGFYNELWDLVDHPNHPGFSVLPTTVGGEVHPIDKAALLTPWLGLASVLILALGSAALTLRIQRTR